MNTRAYIHQFDQLGERSVAEIAATLHRGHLSEVAVKTHQAVAWIAKYDGSPLAIGSIDDLTARRDAFAAEGVRLRAWCVPMGEDVEAEAQFAAKVASVVGGVVELDVEPYAGFWEGDKSLLPAFCRRLRELGASYELDFDARPGGYAPFGDGFLSAARGAVRLMSQSYWSTFGQSWQKVLESAVATMRALAPAVPIGFLFPQDGVAEFPAAVAWSKTQEGSQGPYPPPTLIPTLSTGRAPVGSSQ